MLAACSAPMPKNTQLTPSFLRLTQGKSAQQLAQLLYNQAYQEYHNRWLGECLQMKISRDGTRVIFDNYLYDDRCEYKATKMTADERAQLLAQGKAFRMSEIGKTPTAIAILKGGASQVYRYYLLPNKLQPNELLIGEFVIDGSDFQ